VSLTKQEAKIFLFSKVSPEFDLSTGKKMILKNEKNIIEKSQYLQTSRLFVMRLLNDRSKSGLGLSGNNCRA
jgi:hypothetical protein